MKNTSGSTGVHADWIDITVPVQAGMVVWPGHTPPQITRHGAVANGDEFNISSICMGVHAGTHMDAPLHCFDNRRSIDEAPVGVGIGPARVIRIRDTESIKLEELKQYGIHRGERILFKTVNSERCRQTNLFFEDYVYITKETARFIVDSGVRLVGIDYLGVGGFRCDLLETHRILLGADIWLVEGLDLSCVGAGNYELICLPLRLLGADGAPVRAVLRRAD